MFSIRLVASDLDGTLLRTGGSLSEYSRDVLQRAQARNICLVLVTGRPVGSFESWHEPSRSRVS